jgi:hypothetical protein
MLPTAGADSHRAAPSPELTASSVRHSRQSAIIAAVMNLSAIRDTTTHP